MVTYFAQCTRYEYYALALVIIVTDATAEYCRSYYDIYGNYKSGFYCPQIFDRSTERYCCGTSRSKYCCSSSGYIYSPYNIVGTVVGIVFGIICLIVVGSLVVCCFCAACPLYQRRHQGRIISRAPVTHTTVHTVGSMPVNYTAASGNVTMFAANPQLPPYAPAYPPPPYSNSWTTTTTTTTNGMAY